MGETCKSLLRDIYREKKWGVKKDIQSKYIEKGLMVEDSAIAFYSTFKGGFYSKNEQFFKNEFICGTPDIVGDKVVDIKSSWNAFTFPSKGDKVDKNYYWQLMGYMWLTGLDSATLTYVLLDTPEQLIQDEMRRLAWKMGVMDEDASPEYVEACQELRKQMTFNQIPIEERIVEFEIQRSESDIELIKSRVLEAREYLSKL